MQEQQKSFFAPGAILFVGFLIALAIFFERGVDTLVIPRIPERVAEEAPASVVDAAKEESGIAVSVSEDDDAVLGSPSAPITIIEFSDFQCPFCGVFARDIKPKLEETYILPGKVKLVYRDYPILGEESRLAAVAAECAGEQGKFWEYQDILYQNQRAENQGGFRTANLFSFAQKLSLDAVAFGSCLSSGTYDEEVAKDTADAQAAGVPGTPVFIIQGKLYAGISTFEGFQAIIEKELGAIR
ncbi:MAG: hypothetical protein A2756_02920 [Candidatus Ryanbacteria bacterium RIFCSPHIGHO2_01_FULL_48_27]|uniref:Thioredoxin domain-containing protein n=1 Tax=Candidatus Ryanbacteria bacterium RIFCSPHIGHO2_01_FULL_48_27 TaxID=1802115 RepID=A0A1G2G6F9_9BACT|nr:MAG: hypothetical protein A2756_02920 [Candidatus Ryanbacteria bacterium RIFCSPHIGHO2_01_FULL_48_27]